MRLALETWPTAPLLYDSFKGPMYTTPALYVQALAYLFVQLTWTLSFIIAMARAHMFAIRHLSIFYCFLSRAPFVMAEGFWYMCVFEDIETEVWSLNIARNREYFSSSDAINSRLFLLFGFKRSIKTLTLTIVFTSLAFRNHHERSSWIMWLSIILLLNFTLRS